MFLLDLTFALLVALLFTGFLVRGLTWRHPTHPGTGAAATFLFLVLLALVWAVGSHTAPYGPVLWGGYWLPYLVAGLLVSLLILAVSARPLGPGPGERPPPDEPNTPANDPAAADVAAAFSAFFWLLMGAALVSLLLHYLRA